MIQIEQELVKKYTRMLEMIREASRERPVSTAALMQALQISERTVRAFVELARSQKMPIAKGPTGGYYFANNWQEFSETFRKNCSQALSTLRTMNIIRHNLAHQQQLTIFDVQTEYDDLLEYIEQLSLSEKAA
jgi:predicted DNA-binding transcriptional regulator YafY